MLRADGRAREGKPRRRRRRGVRSARAGRMRADARPCVASRRGRARAPRRALRRSARARPGSDRVRCTGPVRQWRPCQPRPARQCSHDSKSAKAKQVVTNIRAARATSARKPQRRRGASASSARSRTPKAASQTTAAAERDSERPQRQRPRTAAPARRPGPRRPARAAKARARTRSPAPQERRARRPRAGNRSKNLHAGKDTEVTSCAVLTTVVATSSAGRPPQSTTAPRSRASRPASRPRSSPATGSG